MKMITKAVALTASTLLLGASAAFGVPPAADATGTVNLTGYGADSCTAPSTSQMSAFWNNTPFSYWGIYIGGSSRGCAQPNLTSSWITTVIGQGWDLLPIWVGPQNPCGSGFSTYFSTDPNTAYNQGAQEALSAYRAWHAMNPDSDVPIEYDLEGVSGETTTCRTAAKSFINGWVAQMHVAPAQPAGVYSSACGGNIDDFASIANPPDFIDAADWDGDPDAYNVSCVPSTDWSGWHRHKQYQGDHNATYNGVTLNIDSRCAAGPVYGTADHTSSTHPCAGGGAAAVSAARTAATDQAGASWHGAIWASDGPLNSQLRRGGMPVKLTGIPLQLSNVPANAPTVGTPAVLPDGSLMVPVTTHGKRATTRIYTTTDDSHFRLRTTIPLSNSYAAGVAPATAVRPDGTVTVLDHTRALTWSPTSGHISTGTSNGLPTGAESLHFTGPRSARAVVETEHCTGKSACAPNPTTYFTTDGGRTWHR